MVFVFIVAELEWGARREGGGGCGCLVVAGKERRK